ncbi:hypothetical protein AVEN_38245-1 [Araneus ventricosus]|uniref:Uncharacterized protein n=1 Tax=Araneus ventricosus TaxID=182803 RepID=A0A4Y2U499_ARAVE|nr:hypothetical protein AVEN_38245-1 [Araneus ventricosus]
MKECPKFEIPAPKSYLKKPLKTASLQTWQTDWDGGETGKLIHNIVTNVESRFPAMLVLWLGREFYKVKHGVTAATVPGPLTLATNLATNR